MVIGDHWKDVADDVEVLVSKGGHIRYVVSASS